MNIESYNHLLEAMNFCEGIAKDRLEALIEDTRHDLEIVGTPEYEIVQELNRLAEDASLFESLLEQAFLEVEEENNN